MRGAWRGAEGARAVGNRCNAIAPIPLLHSGKGAARGARAPGLPPIQGPGAWLPVFFGHTATALEPLLVGVQGSRRAG